MGCRGFLEMRMVKDFVDVANHASLDALIEALVSLRDSLPEGADAEMRIRGDDVFGRTLSISFLRPQTEEEAACEGRYAHLMDAQAIDLAA